MCVKVCYQVFNSASHFKIIHQRVEIPQLIHNDKKVPAQASSNNNNNNNNKTFDCLLRDCIQRITNSNLSDIQWLQASLPVKDGGLGVRRVSSLSIPAYLASAASTLSLQADILSGCACADDSYLQSYLSSWSSSFGAIPDTLPARQPFWDRPGIQADRLLVESSLSSAFQWASFLAALSKHSRD